MFNGICRSEIHHLCDAGPQQADPSSHLKPLGYLRNQGILHISQSSLFQNLNMIYELSIAWSQTMTTRFTISGMVQASSRLCHGLQIQSPAGQLS